MYFYITYRFDGEDDGWFHYNSYQNKLKKRLVWMESHQSFLRKTKTILDILTEGI